MPIDASIYSQVGQGVPQIDVAGSLGRGLQLRQLMQAKKDDDTMRALAQQSGGDLPQLADLAQQRGLYKQAGAIRKQHLDTQKEIVDIQESLGKVDAQRRAAIQAGNEDLGKMAAWADTPEKWQQGIQVVVRDHPIIAQGLQPFLQYTPENRAAVMTKAAKVDAAFAALHPKIEEINGVQVPVTTDILGRQTFGAPVGVKAQTEVGKANQEAAAGLISAEDAAALKQKATTHGALVNIGYSQPFEVTDPVTGKSKLVQQDKKGNLRVVEDFAPKGGDRPLTEAQGNALGFGIRAREADVILNRIEAAGANVAGGLQRVASSVPGVGNYMTPAPLQEYDQAKRNFVSAVLRKESGAAISASEFANEEKKYFPQPGDSKEVIQQKADARKTAIGVLQIQAGRDLPEVVKPVKPAKPGARLQSGKVWTVKDDSDYSALPPGAHYKGPDGIERIK